MNNNVRLKSEFANSLYDVFDEAIIYMKDKQNYKQNDIVKLLLALKKGKYNYITNDKGYRDQIKLLSDFFSKEYNHLLISLVLIKNFITCKDSDIFLTMINNKDMVEHIIYLLEKKDYDELMGLMENDKKVFLAFCKVYEQHL